MPIQPTQGQRDTHQKLVKKAISLAGGRQVDLAMAMREVIKKNRIRAGVVHQGHIGHWLHGRHLVSPAMAVVIELAVNAPDITRKRFYPELYQLYGSKTLPTQQDEQAA